MADMKRVVGVSVIIARTSTASWVSERMRITTHRRRSIVVTVCWLSIILVRALLRECSRISCARSHGYGAGVGKGRRFGRIVHAVAMWIVVGDVGCSVVYITSMIVVCTGRECQIGRAVTCSMTVVTRTGWFFKVRINFILILKSSLTPDEKVDDATDKRSTY